MKLFNILEAKCYELDFQLAVLSGRGSGLTDELVESMKKAFQDIRQLQKEIEDTELTVTLVYQKIFLKTNKNIEDIIIFEDQIKAIYEPRLVYLAKIIETKVSIFINKMINFISVHRIKECKLCYLKNIFVIYLLIFQEKRIATILKDNP